MSAGDVKLRGRVYRLPQGHQRQKLARNPLRVLLMPLNHHRKKMRVSSCAIKMGTEPRKLINGFGQACKVVAISSGVLIFLGCALATSILDFAVVKGLVFGSIVGFVGWVVGVFRLKARS